MAAHRETLTVDIEEINTFHTLGEIMNLMDELGSNNLSMSWEWDQKFLHHLGNVWDIFWEAKNLETILHPPFSRLRDSVQRRRDTR